MILTKEKIVVNSFNCRGLRDKKKRCSVFGWLKTRHNGITMLQETHSVFHDEIQWKQEWDGDIYFSHGNNLSRGVAILVPKNLKSLFKTRCTQREQNARLDVTSLTSVIKYNTHPSWWHFQKFWRLLGIQYINWIFPKL